MNKWFIFNGLLLLIALHILMTNIGQTHIRFGVIGLLFFIYNWTRHAMFSTIRSDIPRKRKIKFAQLSKRALPIHRWTGTTALIFIIIHFIYIIKLFGFSFTYLKFTTGFIAGLVLVFLVLTGWLRLYWPSPLKRQVHLKLGLSLFVLIVVHVVV